MAFSFDLQLVFPAGRWAAIPTEPEQYQGERLFCNNNRLFVFLAYRNRFVDGRELKGRTTAIGERINSLLNNLAATDFHSVHYHYDKEADLVGDYIALSLSTIYYE